MHREDRCLTVIGRPLQRGKRGRDRRGARRGFSIGHEAAIVQLGRRGMNQLAGIEEAAHHACRWLARRSTRNPPSAETIDPISTPILTASIVASSWKASPPMNRLIVKPIPHSSDTP